MRLTINEDGGIDHKTRSTTVDEIISRKPNFFSRWALVIFLIILLILLSITWFVQYADIVTVKAKLISVNAPKTIVCKTDGKLINLTIKNDDFIKANTIAGYMESTSDYEQVLTLSADIDSFLILFSKNKVINFSKLTIKHYRNLGELQQAYQTFLNTLIDFNNYTKGGYSEKKQLILAVNLVNIKRRKILLDEQKIAHQQDVTLSEKTFEMNEVLKKEKIISELEYRNEKSKLIAKQLSIPQINQAIIANETEQMEKEKEIIEFNNTIAQQISIFRQSHNTLKSAIDEWKNKYLLIAPVSGKINFAGFIQKNQQLSAGQTVCFITPHNSDFFAETFIPQSNFGKVKKGEKVLLNFSSYPSQEFGSVIGKLDFISTIPSDSGYLAKIIFPNGLITNYNKEVLYREGLTADAQIITKDMRMIKRIYYSFKKETQR